MLDIPTGLYEGQDYPGDDCDCSWSPRTIGAYLRRVTHWQVVSTEDSRLRLTHNCADWVACAHDAS